MHHLSGDEPLPNIQENTLVLYASHYCVYSVSALTVLNYLSAEHHEVLVNASAKPAAYLQRFPHGQLPILECANEKIVAPDLICMFINECNPNQKVLRTASDHEAKIAIWHKSAKAIGDVVNDSTHLAASTSELEALFGELNGLVDAATSADDVTLSDLLVFTTVELGVAMLCAASASSNAADDANSHLRRYANLAKWRESLLPLLPKESLARLFDTTRLTAFYRSCLSGAPNYEV